MASSRSMRTFRKSRGSFLKLPRYCDTAKHLNAPKRPTEIGMKGWWNMSESKRRPSVVLVHGAWADGSSWNDIIGPLLSKGLNVLAAPIPLTSLSDDIAALDRALERTDGAVVLVAHAYAGAVIQRAPTRESNHWSSLRPWRLMKAREWPTCSIATSRIRWRPNWHLTRMGSSGCGRSHLAPLSLNTRLPNGLRFLPQHSGRSLSPAFRRRLRDPLGK